MNVWTRTALDWIVVPTNAGWKRDGRAVMGDGLAVQAANRFPHVPLQYGALLRLTAVGDRNYGIVSVDTPSRLILFPTKALNRSVPHMSWKHPADTGTIQRSVEALAAILKLGQCPDGRILVPPVGCGLGGLTPDVVRPLLEPLVTAAPGRVVFTWEVP